MKKVLLIASAVMAISAAPSAYAQTTQAAAAAVDVPSVAVATTYTPCNGITGKSRIWGGSGEVPAAGTSTYFTKVGFDVQCSSNTLVSFREVSAVAAAVASGSLKGNQSYMGATNGGAVATYRACTGTSKACITADLTAAMTAAALLAGS